MSPNTTPSAVIVRIVRRRPRGFASGCPRSCAGGTAISEVACGAPEGSGPGTPSRPDEGCVFIYSDAEREPSKIETGGKLRETPSTKNGPRDSAARHKSMVLQVVGQRSDVTRQEKPSCFCPSRKRPERPIRCREQPFPGCRRPWRRRRCRGNGAIHWRRSLALRP